ncbi:transposase [Alienimonas sp. DA493]|uniref:transposase n=1 Tax=Alienimonas sp. DA493 TaxID=3373605 RepID=UPI003754DB50
MTELRRLHHPRPGRTPVFSDVRILEVYFFAAVHRLPIGQACDRRNWPICLRGRPLPSGTTMSRRMRSPSVRRLLAALDRALVRTPGGGIVAALDGSAIRIGPHSTDRHAKFGLAGGVTAKGYRLHLLRRADGTIADWRLTPLGGPDGCEKRMAKRMLRAAPSACYVVADGNYDANTIHAEADAAGVQLVSPKRKGGFGRRRQRPGRLRSFALLRAPTGSATASFGAALMRSRVAIERAFGALKASSAGLTDLPPWVRTYPRVLPYVTAKLILHALRPTVG